MNKKIVLIVDDDPDILDSMTAILESKDITVFSTSNSNEALTLFNKEKPPIVFLDLMIEQVDSGITLCKAIRKIESNVKIYLLSSVGDEFKQTLDLEEHGFNGSISKPVSAEELINLVS